jgi:hypothetical protein
MKKVLILSLLLCNCSFAFSQKSIHSNIGIFGGSKKTDGYYVNSFSSILGSSFLDPSNYKTIINRPFNFYGSQGSKEKISVEIYPNPTSDFVQIKTTCKSINYAMIDMTGKLCLNGNTSKIDIKTLSSGIYIIQISNFNTIIHTEKIIIQ